MYNEERRGDADCSRIFVTDSCCSPNRRINVKIAEPRIMRGDILQRATALVVIRVVVLVIGQGTAREVISPRAK